MENVRLGGAYGREPAVAEQLGTYHRCLVDKGGSEFGTGCLWLGTVGGVADLSTLGSTLRQRDAQTDSFAYRFEIPEGMEAELELPGGEKRILTSGSYEI